MPRVTGRAGRAQLDATFIARLRRSLALLYGMVLAATLIASGFALYFTLRFYMTNAVAAQITQEADLLTQPWVNGTHDQGAGGMDDNCHPRSEGRPPGPPGPGGKPVRPRAYVACFSREGKLMGSSVLPPDTPDPVAPSAAFLDPALARKAVASGKSWDVVDGGPVVGQLVRAAVAIPASVSATAPAVVQVAEPLPEPLRSLELIRNVMLMVAAAALLVTAGGGWLLAGRALVPARLAVERQHAFIADASHELRAPLALLRANVEVLLRERDQFQPEHAAMIDDILRETNHLTRLTSSLLTLASLDSQQRRPEVELVDLADIAGALSRRVKALAEAKGVMVQCAPIPPATTLGDRGYLEQAALVLLENAVKYTSAGGSVTLSTYAQKRTASLLVEDTGIGMSEEQLQHLGERFYRANKSRGSTSSGNGLGISIALSIARAHGGTLRLDSAMGQGTRAELMLPAFSDRAPTAASQPER